MCFFSYGQSLTQTVRGIVTDADSKSPIPGAVVLLTNIDTVIGTTTDLDGKFRLEKVPVGRRSLQFRFFGYQEVNLDNIVVTTGKEIVLNVEMTENSITTEEVVIVKEKDKTKANNELATTSARSFRSEETERYAGSRGDPSKMVANYAGVATGNDARNDIIVRGNSPLGVLWRLEGVDIPNPNHFSTQGATGGPVSMLNNNLLGNSDFLTGAFPAEYGNKMAAVFDLKLRNGNNERMEYTGQIGFNGLEFGVEGPLSKEKGSSFLINYRYSTFELFQLMGISFGVSALPKYQDLSFKVNVPTKKSGVFSFWGLGGKSHIELLDSERDSADWSFTDSGEDLIFTSMMGATGLSHNYFFNGKTSGKFSVAFSSSLFKISIDTLSLIKTPHRVYTNNSTDAQLTANYTLTHKMSQKHLFKAGLIFSQLFYNYNSTYWSRKFERYVNEFEEKNNTGLAQAFGHWQFRINQELTFNSGLHLQMLTLNNALAVEPRLGLRWQFHQKQAITFAGGLHSQMNPLIYYFLKSYDSTTNSYTQTNRELNFSKAIHYVGGYDFNFSKDFRLKLEAYYQDLFNIPVEFSRPTSFSMINVGNDLEGLPLVDSLQNQGSGKNYGAEITIEKFFSKHYYFLVTTTLYESKYRGSDKVERHSAFSGGYVFNSLAGYEIPFSEGRRILSFDLKYTLAGGNRYTPVNLEQSIIEKRAVYDETQSFTKKFRDYQKLDFKVSFRKNSKKASQWFFINIENILNRKNILRQVYDQESKTVVNEYQLGLFPYAGYRIEF